MSTGASKKYELPLFRERLGELCGERSYAEFAKFLGMSRATVGFYMAGERIPNAADLKKIAEKCGVTADYLLGLSSTTSVQNREISAATGLSDDAIEVLHQSAKNPYRQIAYDEIIKDERLLRYATNYLFSFLEDERKESRLRFVPISKRLSPDYGDANLVRIIELLPLWRQDMIAKIKNHPQTMEKLLMQYVAHIANINACHLELEGFEYEPTDLDTLPDDCFTNDDLAAMEEEKKEIERAFELEKRQTDSAIQEVLDFIESSKR